MEPKTKLKINLAVLDYKRMFPEEYAEFFKVIQDQRENLADDFATIKGTQSIERALHTIPETLWQMINKKLNQEEMASFKELEGARWFAKTHPQFAVTKEV